MLAGETEGSGSVYKGFPAPLISSFACRKIPGSPSPSQPRPLIPPHCVPPCRLLFQQIHTACDPPFINSRRSPPSAAAPLPITL